jgi:hypothetical protein
MARSHVSKILFTSALLGGVVLACGGSKPGSGFDNGGGDDDGGGLSSSGGSSGFGDGGNPLVSPDAACASDTQKAQQQPLDIYIMLDQSGSMKDPVPGGDKWSAVSSALKTFVQQPQLAGVGVGLQYFGVPPSGANGCPPTCASDADCGSQGPCIPFIKVCGGCIAGGGTDSCNAADYAKPEVEIAPLPGVAQAITTSIGAHNPSTSTPTSAALQGAVDHAKSWSQAHPGHVVIALLATDGDPTECDTDLTHIDGIAQAAASGSPKILTFVIGVGPSLSALNGIAQAGGTGQAYVVDTNANVNQQFLDALNKIRGTAAGCTYVIPAPAPGKNLDYDQVNVEYTPGGGGPPVILPKVADKAHCPATGDAWYYDDNSKPTQILLCDTSCKTVSNDSTGSISMIIGCASVVR